MKFVNDGNRDKVHDMPNIVSVEVFGAFKIIVQILFIYVGVRRDAKDCKMERGGGGGVTRRG